MCEGFSRLPRTNCALSAGGFFILYRCLRSLGYLAEMLLASVVVPVLPYLLAWPGFCKKIVDRFLCDLEKDISLRRDRT